MAVADYDTIARFALGLTQISRPIVLGHFRQNPSIQKKTDGTPLTQADTASENALRSAIAKQFPQHGIIGEEGGDKNPNADTIWLIDPIDGTRAFACGNPLFGTLIAVVALGKPIIGVIDLPALGQCWLGVKGRPTQMNGTPVTTSSLDDSAAASLTTTSRNALGEYYGRFARLSAKTMVTNYGGDCANYAHLASGWCDITAEANLKPHDMMALVPIIEGAGGVISHWDGAAITLDTPDDTGTVLATASPILHNQALQILNASMVQ